MYMIYRVDVCNVLYVNVIWCGTIASSLLMYVLMPAPQIRFLNLVRVINDCIVFYIFIMIQKCLLQNNCCFNLVDLCMGIFALVGLIN